MYIDLRDPFFGIAKPVGYQHKIIVEGKNGRESAWSPSANLVELEDSFILSLDIPGVDPDLVKIEYLDDFLSISGERKAGSASTATRTHLSEAFVGKFKRAFSVKSIDAQTISAKCSDGVLTIKIPKLEKAKARKISIEVD